jgi:putative hemolysin
MEEGAGPSGLIAKIVIILFVILGAGFFSFLKTALGCCKKPRLRLLAEGGDKKYEAVFLALEKAPPLLASLRIMIIFLEILAGFMGAGFLLELPADLFASLGLGRSWAVSLSVFFLALLFTAVLFLLAEAVPRRVGRGMAEAAAALFLPFIKFLPCLAAPLLLADRFVSAGIKKIFPPGGPGHTGMTEDELRIALLEGEKSGIVESEERTMVEGVFYLGDRPAGAFMTHRSEVRWLDINAGSEEALLTAEAGGGQRYFPVADGELDEVSGAVSAEDILKALVPRPDSPAPSWPGLKALTLPPYFVPETMPAIKAFEAFKKAGADYLFVMDEYGGFAGILTVRNLIEEIVGQLSASEAGGEEILLQEDGSWLADGSVNIDAAARALSLSGLGGEHGDYHTLAGFILDLAGEIPKTGARFDYHGYRFKIVDMDGNRIDKVLISRL